ncbi:alpha/beta hydrolase [uncultured Algoriphagus sp.]|uniref:alpha/beta hydrolase n=1 Tax=uncultured Algoriphagus sp. TaxID=417365 RepID=UPI0030EC1589
MNTNKIFTLLTLVLLLSTHFSVSAQEFETLTYYEDDSIKLELDLFLPEAVSSSKIPLVIYVHGGGFSTGDRTGGHNLAKFLAKKNVAVASISYTLFMKDKSFSCDGKLPEKIKAIQLAANQVWLSTEFFLANQEEYTIDPAQIFAAGSSAGAEAVLHAAFWDRSLMNLYENNLPDTFKYAGIISGAGAIMDLNLITDQSLVPVMMFHGDSDPTVPYATAAHHYCPTNASGWLMLFGSKSIFDHIVSMHGAATLITYVGGTHGSAGAHFYQDQQPVYDFIHQVLEGKEVFQNQVYRK